MYILNLGMSLSFVSWIYGGNIIGNTVVQEVPKLPVDFSMVDKQSRIRAASEIVDSEHLSKARKAWGDRDMLVNHVQYQLRFRSQTDYLSMSSQHLGEVLEKRPVNDGIEKLGLYMLDSEAQEFRRRQQLGDRIPQIVQALGNSPQLIEGEEPEFDSNFAGVWQDQKNGGVLVVALVEPKLVEHQKIFDIAGGADHVRIVDVEYSWSDVEGFRDKIWFGLKDKGVKAEVRIHSTPSGRMLEIVMPDPKKLDPGVIDGIPSSLLTVSQGELDVTEGNPVNMHVEVNQMPGLGISCPGDCMWGSNGHRFWSNYLVTAGHCGPLPFEDFEGTVDGNVEFNQSGFDLTPGSQYQVSIRDGSTFDMKIISSPQADSNCYHTNQNRQECFRFISERALHNSWEVGADTVCAMLRTTGQYECGFVVEENVTSTCGISRAVRYAIDTSPGDSGAGLIWPEDPPSASIDAIHACGGGAFGLGNTAYDVQNELGFEFNCSHIFARDVSASAWSNCPTVNR